MQPILELRDIDKTFIGVKALQDVHLTLYPGEVLALVGENGAGKSTLMKIIAGVHQPDSGQILMDGQPVRIESPKAAEALGISIIHQEFNLIPHLSIAENIFLGREPHYGYSGFINWKAMYRETREILGRLGLRRDPTVDISRLPVCEQQMVEIAKALSLDCRVMIMDEPTAALNDEETGNLFRMIDLLRQSGVGVIYISHRLEEIFKVANRVTVLRDGRYITTMNVGGTNKKELVQHMVGRDLTDYYPKQRNQRAAVALRVDGLSVYGHLRKISFEVHEGEVLGIAGLMGSGRTTLAKAIFGEYPISEGRIFVGGREVRIRSPRDAIRVGLSLVADKRKEEGLVLPMSVAENLTLSSMDKLVRSGGFIDRGKERNVITRDVELLKIKTQGTHLPVQYLSGGNQQKVVIGKWLETEPKVLIMNEPTRGIDVGAKAEIYQLISRLTSQGMAVIMISSEMPELLGMSDRILVMHEGKVTGEFSIEEATQENIMVCATGG